MIHVENQLNLGDVILGDASWTVYSAGGSDRDFSEFFSISQEPEIDVRTYNLNEVRLSDHFNYLAGKEEYIAHAKDRIKETGLVLAGSKFVVVSAYDAGSSSQGRNGKDEYYNGWQVTAQQLNADGSYSESNPLIRFHQPPSSCVTQIDDVKAIGKMERTVTFAPA